MKKIPKPIADLKINWTFDGSQGERPFVDSEEIFKNLNSEIQHHIILPGVYKFFIIDKEFEIDVHYKESITYFIVHCIDYEIWCKQSDNQLSHNLILDKFELISKNTFRIHIRE